MLIEGIKQTMAASRHLPDGVAAMGLLGCWNWSSAGFPGDDLHHLLRHSKATRFVVAFDADVSSNPNVKPLRLDAALLAAQALSRAARRRRQ